MSRSITPNRATQEYYSTPQAAIYMGVAAQTLANWRTAGVGPHYVRVGEVHARIFYKRSDLDTFMSTRYAVGPLAPRRHPKTDTSP